MQLYRVLNLVVGTSTVECKFDNIGLKASVNVLSYTRASVNELSYAKASVNELSCTHATR